MKRTAILCIIQSLLTGAFIGLTSCASNPDGHSTTTTQADGSTVTTTVLPPTTMEDAIKEMCKRPLQ